ncbi:MAG: universal stress protein [Vicinamibacterales bacterium]
MIPIKHILVPTDFSEPADAAVSYARTLAAEFGGRLHLLHVVPEPNLLPWGSELSTVPFADLLTQTEMAARERLTEIAAAMTDLAGRVTVEAQIGTPVERVLTYIDEHHIDLVVMGTHGRGLVGHMLLGSVAERVVRRSPVPVLTVHSVPAAPDAKRAPVAHATA